MDKKAFFINYDFKVIRREA